MYGKELIVDMRGCPNLSIYEDLRKFCQELADLVDMQIEDFHYWRSNETDEKDPKTYGVSAIQFILTSNITVHVLPLLNGGSVYINLFSCKEFQTSNALMFIKDWFGAKSMSHTIVERR